MQSKNIIGNSFFKFNVSLMIQYNLFYYSFLINVEFKDNTLYQEQYI